ncbi:MurR/RpiR family transcriptional regulator [Listeria grandensis]|uniref:MurR/RpiR family transcriptional regulator n=1 Tax=Listeria grandensis TaxID=1494963 RepID=UPI0016273B21|nr:MurR/RpiR family transcriptional regulator [Listeria grandensis]MBC1474580.1 MurR/RpiR family transcriptional regulator [Listeria grandensis]
MGKVAERFVEDITNLSDSEKYVFYYADNHIEQVKNITLTNLAEILNTSNTTIIRMCHKLGLQGFSEFKFILASFSNQKKTRENGSLKEDYLAQLTQTIHAIDLPKMDYIATKILNASTVIVVSVGLTKMIGEYIGKRLIQVQKPTMYAYESHIIDLLPSFIKPNDVILFVSMSGDTKTLVQAAQKLEYSGCFMFAITNHGDSALSQLMDTNLSSDIPTVSYAGYDITSRSGLMIQADILLEVYLKKMLERDK